MAAALNIAVALKRLGIEAGNALPLGQGGGLFRNRMAKEDLISPIDNAEGDNGWCLALVEPDGERTLCHSAVDQWNRQWLARLTAAPGACSIFPVINWPHPPGRIVSGMAGKAERTRLSILPRLAISRMRYRRIGLSTFSVTNRQEAEIAAERFALSAEITTRQAIAGELPRR